MYIPLRLNEMRGFGAAQAHLRLSKYGSFRLEFSQPQNPSYILDIGTLRDVSRRIVFETLFPRETPHEKGK